MAVVLTTILGGGILFLIATHLSDWKGGALAAGLWLLVGGKQERLCDRRLAGQQLDPLTVTETIAGTHVVYYLQ